MADGQQGHLPTGGLALAGEPTLLETCLPFRELSLVIEADQRALDPVYGAHRWWARRPPALMRGMLLAATMPTDRPADEFWEAFGDPGHRLSGIRIHDPFVGGGSTVVEAARLGAIASGGDIDPLAVEIVRHELQPAPAAEVREVGAALLDHLDELLGDLYPAADGANPLHYFWLHEVTCPACSSPGLLYRKLILARDTGRPGAVVRDSPVTAFCPMDLTIHHLSSANRLELRHCGRRFRLDRGTFRGGKYTCPNCGERSAHRALRTGVAPRRLIAVEETPAGLRRRLRPPNASDLAAVVTAASRLQEADGLCLPSGSLTADRQDPRPVSYGIDSPRLLFSDRQLIVLGRAMAWLRKTDVSAPGRRALTMALSNALATNNKLCSYAVDYGRLSALFSVRGYSLPAQPVELNPLHPDGGRGTFRHCIERVARSATPTVRRHTWSAVDAAPSPRSMVFEQPAVPAIVNRTPAETPIASEIDVCIFDPPYYDYIAYGELSEFYRSWLDPTDPIGKPLMPSGDDKALQFGADFGGCLLAVLRQLVPGGIVAFTYHSASPDAWRAVGLAMDHADLAVTGLWPVRSDGHMGHHSHPGNCEWDLVLACRRRAESRLAPFEATLDDWLVAVEPLAVGDPDRRSMELAIATVIPRFATAAPGHHRRELGDDRRRA